jgi:hypothetical protein
MRIILSEQQSAGEQQSAVSTQHSANIVGLELADCRVLIAEC